MFSRRPAAFRVRLGFPLRGSDGLGVGPAGPPVPRNYAPGAGGGGGPLCGIPSGVGSGSGDSGPAVPAALCLPPVAVPASRPVARRRRPWEAAPEAAAPEAAALHGARQMARLEAVSRWRTSGGVTAGCRPAARSAGRGGAGRGGVGRARIREAPFGAAPAAMESVAVGQEAARQAPAAADPRQPWYQVVANGPAARQAPSQARPLDAAAAAQEAADVAARPGSQPTPCAPHTPVGARRCHSRRRTPRSSHQPRMAGGTAAPSRILWRQWDAAATAPSAAVTAAIDRLAEFPRELQEKLAAGLDGIYAGDGGVPDLDDMSALHGVPLPSGRATWDACAGAYGERKIVVGSRPSPTPT